MHSGWKLLGFLLIPGLWHCGGPAQAEDPRSILGEWGSHEGVEGTQGGEGSGDAVTTKGGTQAPPVKLATAEQCSAAARRVEDLALKAVVDEEKDPAEKQKLEARRKALMASTETKERIQRAAEDCQARSTSENVALCIARANGELDVDRCER